MAWSVDLGNLETNFSTLEIGKREREEQLMEENTSWLKKRAKLYIDLTNSCNLACPFCCANSLPSNTRFMSSSLFRSIIEKDGHEAVEVQLEGGEPTINGDLWEILDYCDANPKVKKIVLLHNCTKIDECVDFFKSKPFHKPVELKLSLNYYLLSLFPDLVERIEAAHLSLEDTPFVKVYVNARYREDCSFDDEMIRAMFLTRVPASRISVYAFCSFGRGASFEEPCSEWLGYASDGKFFGADTNGRFEYEGSLE